uniref:Spalt like transcription factor 2 n=1 Tax=Panthera tigris altaica TaxID=74533 RepID=A0A8C9MBY3_PANTA
MSRRKQRKPQQLISDCEGPSASENGDASEEDHPQVCAKCCAQFTDPTEFLAHQNACSTDPPVMVIIGGQENPNNSSTSSEPRAEGQTSPRVMEAEHNNPPDSGSSVPTDPTWGPERRVEEPAGHFLVAATEPVHSFPVKGPAHQAPEFRLHLHYQFRSGTTSAVWPRNYGWERASSNGIQRGQGEESPPLPISVSCIQGSA